MDNPYRVFDASGDNFNKLALEIFHFQSAHNSNYRRYCELLHIHPEEVTDLRQIPYLPIRFFKTHDIFTGELKTERVFESSGTTGSVPSRHLIKDIRLYQKSFNKAFTQFYGRPSNYCILGLLPSYLERNNSSLVMMVDQLIKQSGHPQSGFFLHDHRTLHSIILHNEILQQPTLLIGVSYALLDFSEAFPMKLEHTIVMETGGMKGRKKEITREELHDRLKKNLGTAQIHAEYGMTELLSQAYSHADGLFRCPPWMKVLIREEDDPLVIKSKENISGKPLVGALNIIDLANVWSCSFIGTDDLGRLHANGSFEMMGRMDESDIRGCGLLAL